MALVVNGQKIDRLVVDGIEVMSSGLSKSSLVDALQYSGLGITNDTSDADIISKLKDRFPEYATVIAFTGGVKSDDIIRGGVATNCSVWDGNPGFSHAPYFTITETPYPGFVGIYAQGGSVSARLGSTRFTFSVNVRIFHHSSSL